MGKVTQVVLMNATTFADGRRRFRRNVPVTMNPKDAERYRNNGMFAVREIDQAKADRGISNEKINPGDPFKGAVSDESVQLPKRKKKAAKKLTPKQGE